MSNIQAANRPTVAQFFNQEGTRKYIEATLKDRAPQFTTSVVSLANLTPGLAKCKPETLMFCGLKAASLNLPLDNNLGFAYAVPYGDSAQFQLGYKGLVQLAQRTGQYKRINVIDIRQGELVKWDDFTEEIELSLVGDAEKRDALPVVGYAAMFELANGFRKCSYWTKAKVEKHGKRFSKTYNNGPWKTDFDAMAKKTVLKDLLSKWGPLSSEMADAIKFDQAIIRQTETGDEYPEYVDAEFSAEDIVPPSKALFEAEASE